MKNELQKELTDILAAAGRLDGDQHAAFPAIAEIPVRWGDMDAFQHVNNTVYIRYFEIARIVYFDSSNLRSFMTGAGIGPILAEVSCRFRYPVTYPDTVLSATRVVKLETDRFTMEHLVVSRAAGRVAAQGAGTVVTFDYEAGRKAPIPPLLRDEILACEARVGHGVLDE